MLLLLSTALAATVTEIPPFLHGDGALVWTHDRLSGTLGEPVDGVDWDVGHRTLSTHRLDYRLAFAPAPGLVLSLDLEQYASEKVSFDAWQEMIPDPATGTGTYFGTSAQEPTSWSGAGIGGLWIDLGGTPWSEAFTHRNNKATWKLDLAFRTGDKTSFWAVNDAGMRGAGPGGSAWRIRTGFSKRVGNAEPYLLGTVTFENLTSAVLVSPDGSRVSDGTVIINPADHGEILLGAEILAAHNDANGGRLSLDIHLAANYAAAGDVPSGLYLPQVLDASAAGVVQQAESLEAGGGVGIVWRPMDYLQVTPHGDLLYHMPQRIESPYPVYTAYSDTLHLQVGVELTVRIRTPRDEEVAPPTDPMTTTTPWGT